MRLERIIRLCCCETAGEQINENGLKQLFKFVVKYMLLYGTLKKNSTFLPENMISVSFRLK